MRTWVDNTKGFDHDQFQTYLCGGYSVSGDRNTGVCTRSCAGTWLASFLPEPGCRIPVERDGKRHGFGTQRLKYERAGKAHFREALHQRPQDVTGPRQQVGAPIRSKRRSDGPPFLQAPTWRSDTERAAPFFSRQPTSIRVGFAVRPVEGDRYANVGQVLLLHVQQN
jgi:hypothetical protein